MSSDRIALVTSGAVLVLGALLWRFTAMRERRRAAVLEVRAGLRPHKERPDKQRTDKQRTDKERPDKQRTKEKR